MNYRQFSVDWEQWYIFIGSLVKVSLPVKCSCSGYNNINFIYQVWQRKNPQPPFFLFIWHMKNITISAGDNQGGFQSRIKRGGPWSKGNARGAFREQGLARAGRRAAGMWFPPLTWAFVRTDRIAVAKIQGQSILLTFTSILNKKEYLQSLCFM